MVIAATNSCLRSLLGRLSSCDDHSSFPSFLCYAADELAIVLSTCYATRQPILRSNPHKLAVLLSFFFLHLLSLRLGLISGYIYLGLLAEPYYYCVRALTRGGCLSVTNRALAFSLTKY